MKVYIKIGIAVITAAVGVLGFRKLKAAKEVSSKDTEGSSEGITELCPEEVTTEEEAVVDSAEEEVVTVSNAEEVAADIREIMDTVAPMLDGEAYVALQNASESAIATMLAHEASCVHPVRYVMPAWLPQLREAYAGWLTACLKEAEAELDS